MRRRPSAGPSTGSGVLGAWLGPGQVGCGCSLRQPLYSLVAEPDAGRTFHPAAIAIGNQLDQVDVVFRDVGDPTVVLSHVFIDVDAMDNATGVLHQRLDAGAVAD